MSEFFEYLGEVLKRVFQDLGAFFNTAFASPWGPVGENFKVYGELFNQKYDTEFYNHLQAFHTIYNSILQHNRKRNFFKR